MTPGGRCGSLSVVMQSTLPPQTLEGSGYESTRVRQFTVFLENKVGRLQSLVRSLEQGVGKIVALSIEESGDSALVRLIAAHSEFGRELLKTGGFGFSETEMLAVELPKNARQPIVLICSVLLAAEINIHYAYPLLHGPKGPCMALYVDDPTLAARLLIKKQFNLIGESDLQKW